MSWRNGNGKKLDLKLNLSPPRMNRLPPCHQSPSQSSTTVVTTPTSPPSSCISSELNNQQEDNCFSDSPEATSMIVAGCQRCLMYVMLPEKEPRCPKCKSTVLLEVFSDGGRCRSQRHGNAAKTEEKKN